MLALQVTFAFKRASALTQQALQQPRCQELATTAWRGLIEGIYLHLHNLEIFEDCDPTVITLLSGLVMHMCFQLAWQGFTVLIFINLSMVYELGLCQKSHRQSIQTT
ncbi:hypothetical protein WJX77_005397 [Trebouxia sp. C0004]